MNVVTVANSFEVGKPGTPMKPLQKTVTVVVTDNPRLQRQMSS